jgi:hypothetical protein
VDCLPGSECPRSRQAGVTRQQARNPSNASEAVLEPGVWYGNFILPGLVILAVAWLAKRYADAVTACR